jgi:hypothetical protein
VGHNARVARFRPERGLFLLGTLLLAAVAVGWAAEHSHEATGPAVVRLTDVQVSLTSTTGNSKGIGGVEIATLKLFGGTKAIGQGVLTCMVVSQKQRNCAGSYLLPRGMIETSGLINSRLLYTSAITGGTGLYDNARGTLTVTARGLHPRRELLLFRLSG